MTQIFSLLDSENDIVALVTVPAWDLEKKNEEYHEHMHALWSEFYNDDDNTIDISYDSFKDFLEAKDIYPERVFTEDVNCFT